METLSDTVIALDSLEIGFISGKTKKVLLSSLSAVAGRGELIAVIGRNGIGKSTLLRTITGLQASLYGTLQIEGRDIKDYSRKKLAEKVGYISTEPVRISNLSVYGLAAQGRFPHTNWYGRIDARNHEAIMEALSKAGMTDFSARMVTELSDGERQRAMIAMVLAQDAVIMVMDEPTAFLDIRSKFEIMQLLHQLTREKDKTIIFSTHDFDAAVSEADKIWLLLNDRFSEGAPEDLILSGAVNRIFDEAVVRFNPHNGTFITGREIRGSVSVSGEGDLKFWTERAVIRSGYTIADARSSASIFTPANDNPLWRIKIGEQSWSFNNLYSLSSWLRNRTGPIS